MPIKSGTKHDKMPAGDDDNGEYVKSSSERE